MKLVLVIIANLNSNVAVCDTPEKLVEYICRTHFPSTWRFNENVVKKGGRVGTA